MEGDKQNGLETVLSRVGVDLLQREANVHAPPAVYLEKLRARYYSTEIYHGMRDAGRLVEPRDRLYGADKDMPKAHAFETGSLIGLRLLQEFLSPAQKKKMFEVQIINRDPRESGADIDHGLHIAAEDIVECSQRGYNAATAYHDLIESWEDILCPAVIDQPYFRRGFGFAIYMMQEASNIQQMEELEQQLRAGVNWDDIAAGWAAEFTEE